MMRCNTKKCKRESVTANAEKKNTTSFQVETKCAAAKKSWQGVAGGPRHRKEAHSYERRETVNGEGEGRGESGMQLQRKK
jgi:hypothetical protein